MSDYSSFMDRHITYEAQIAEASNGFVSKVNQLLEKLISSVHHHKQRRIDRDAFEYMLLLDDHMLKDIGVTRDDIRWALQLPLSQNASLELEKQAILNRAGKLV